MCKIFDFSKTQIDNLYYNVISSFVFLKLIFKINFMEQNINFNLLQKQLYKTNVYGTHKQ